MIGIYKIQNTINEKCYIGQSTNIPRRWNAHRRRYKQPKDRNYESPLYRAMRKYGLQAFTFEVLEVCDSTELNAKEKYYIQQYNAFWNGYNQTFGGDSGAIQISKPHLSGIISDLEQTNMKHHEIAAKWGVSTEMVQGINTGRYWHHDQQYPIRVRDFKSTKPTFCVDCQTPIYHKSTRCLACENKYRKEHSSSQRPAKDILFKQLMEYQNFSVVARLYNVSDTTIRKWCQQLNLPAYISAYQTPQNNAK